VVAAQDALLLAGHVDDFDLKDEIIFWKWKKKLKTLKKLKQFQHQARVLNLLHELDLK
jgi:hypothetical protein